MVKSTRREQAAATRAAIVRAAHAEFVDNGFHGTTMAAVARRAGVAPQTVYFVFHTKPALISAVVDAAVLGDDPVAPQDTAWYAAMTAEPDPEESLRIFARGAVEVFERASGVSEVLRAAARTDEEVRRTHLHHERLRYEAFREVVEMLAGKGRLRAGHSVDDATDALFTVLGDGTYDQLRTERGWSRAQVEDWLCDVLPPLVLDGDARHDA